jgi:DNA-binding winged helix-turn-helix (wHTH) protein
MRRYTDYFGTGDRGWLEDMAKALGFGERRSAPREGERRSSSRGRRRMPRPFEANVPAFGPPLPAEERAELDLDSLQPDHEMYNHGLVMYDHLKIVWFPRDNAVYQLEPIPYAILSMLAAAAPRVCMYATFCQNLWGVSEEDEEKRGELRFYISELRTLLRRYLHNNVIQTDRGRGYRMPNTRRDFIVEARRRR